MAYLKLAKPKIMAFDPFFLKNKFLIKVDNMEEGWMDYWVGDLFSTMGLAHDSSQSTHSGYTLSQNSDSDSSYFSIPGSKTLADLFIEDKVNYIQELSLKIQSSKQAFQESYLSIYCEISKMAERISQLAVAREKALKSQLAQIRKEKISVWDRQLAICQTTMAWLENIDRSSISLVGDETFSKLCSDRFLKEISFVDAGEIQFETGDYDLVNAIGNLSYGTSSRSKDGFVTVQKIAPKFVIGSKGAGPGQFCRPWGVCCDATGRILVADRSNNRIQIFNEFGKFLIEFGSEGSGPGEFLRPTGIAVDKKCRIIVCDKDNHRIQVFTYSGRFLFKFGKEGNKVGYFNYPWDVATNSHCDIAVSDSKNNRIQLFNEKGRFITKIDLGRHRVGHRTMDMPRGVAFWPDNKLLVTDFNNHKVLVIDENFKTLKTFGREGRKVREFFRPQGIACDSLGRFVVADSKNYRIQFFDHKGYLCSIFGTEGDAPGQFDCPQGIAIHRNGSIIVVDLNNNRIQIF